MSWFRRDPRKKLEQRYHQLLAEAQRLSTISRRQSDAKTAEAATVLRELEELERTRPPRQE